MISGKAGGVTREPLQGGLYKPLFRATSQLLNHNNRLRCGLTPGVVKIWTSSQHSGGLSMIIIG